MPNGVRLVDSQSSFSGGADSSKTPMVATRQNPDGLAPNQIAWLDNAITRGGGVSPRGGLARRLVMPETLLFQGCFSYLPISGSPYSIASIGGVIYKVDLESYAVENLSARFNLYNPPTVPKAFFVQGEEFLVIQAGDYITLPLFWDGVSLVRSRGTVQGPNAVLPEPSFTVPAVGSAVLATLSAPYTGATNEIFMIGGYRYQQVLPTQRYTTNIFCNESVSSIADSPANQTFTLPVGSIFQTVGGEMATLLFPDMVGTMDGSGPPFNATPPLDPVFMLETDLQGAGNFLAASYMFPNGYTTPAIQIQFTTSALASPGANEVWLVNLDDPRTGQSVANPAYPQQAYATQLPAAGPMDYYGGRIWLANGSEYLAGDIVGGSSGSARYQYRDSILYVTENDYLAGGGTFKLPTNAGPITALSHNANIDTALGQGILFPFTRKQIFSVNVPPQRAEWVNLSEPIQRVAQLNYGTVSDRSVTAVNGDLFFRRIDGVASLISAIRYFGQWANPPLSNEEERALIADDPTLLDCAFSFVFNQRLYQACLPTETAVGIAYQGLMPLDFEPIASARQQMPPVWNGLHEGLDFLQVITGDFNGYERAFAFVRSRYSGQIELWELTEDKEDTNAGGLARISWILETRSFDFGNPNQLKQLETVRFWIDRLYGRADFTLYYRNDQNACWIFWNAWSQCAARTDCEDPGNEYCPYPTQTYKQQYRTMMLMPKPPAACDEQSDRPSDLAYSFQLRLVIKGFCRLRGIFGYALERMEQPFSQMKCIADNVCGTCTEGPEGPPGTDGQRGSGFTTHFGTFPDPNGNVVGVQGDLYKDTDSGQLWVKATMGTGNTGWS